MTNEKKQTKRDIEFSKLPKSEQERLLKARKDRFAKLEKVASGSIDELESDSVSDREYNAKFNKIYNYVRKSLVVLAARKKLKSTVGEELYNETVEMLETAKNL